MPDKITRLIDKIVQQSLLEAQDSTGVRVNKERQLASEIAMVLDEQEDEEEEKAEEADLFADEPAVDEPAADEPGEGEVEDVEVAATAEEETGEGEEEASVDVEATEEEEADTPPKPKRKMSAPPIATGTSYKDFKHNFNIIRSAKAISKTVDGEKMITKTGLRLRNYYDELGVTEKKTLQQFMIGLAQVLLVGKKADAAVHPDIQKTEKEVIDVSVAEPVPDSAPPIRVVGAKVERLIRSKGRLPK